MNRPQVCGNDSVVSGCLKILNKLASNLFFIIFACDLCWVFWGPT
jgi:hypothetical protein